MSQDPPSSTPEPYQPPDPYQPAAPYQSPPAYDPTSADPYRAPEPHQPGGQPAAADQQQPGYPAAEPYGAQSSGVPYSAQPYGAQPLGKQPESNQPYGPQQYGAQPYGAQPHYGAQPYGAQPYGAQPYAGPQPYGAPQYAAAPYSPYGPGYPTRGTNAMAIASLVCSLGGLLTCFSAPVGIVLGHVAKKQIKMSGEEGDGMATAGLVIGYLLTLGMLAFIAFWIILVGFGAASDFN